MTIKQKILIGVACVACVLVGVVFGSITNDEPKTTWKTAMFEYGTPPEVVRQALTLGSQVLTIDTLGNPAIAGGIVLKAVDEEGEPHVAVYYKAVRVLVNNLPSIAVDTIPDTTKKEN